MTRIFFSAFFLAALCQFSPPAFSAQSPHESERGKQIIALVDSAAALIESKGKDSFAELKKDKKWYSGTTYVFVDDMNGLVLVNPPSPELEGKNLLDWKDAKGKTIVREFIQLAKSKGAGWVDYWWPKPGEEKPSKKMSYIKKAKMPTGQTVVVGAGIYID
jgi:cytochrome c